MIRYIVGKLKGKTDRGIVVFVGNETKSNKTDTGSECGVGYEVELTAAARRSFSGLKDLSEVALYISFQQSERQPVPRLYGFRHELERNFFEELIRVPDVGPSVALSAMSAVPVRQIAKAIVERDVGTLKSLKGIGEKTAEKMIAELRNRAAKYALLPEDAGSVSEEPPDFRAEVSETLVKQLHFKPAEAQRLIEQAMKENPSVKSAEDLFDEVLRLHK